MQIVMITTLTVVLLLTYVAAIQVCNGDISYVVISRRNSTGHREVESDLTVAEDRVRQGDVRLQVKQSAFAENGIQKLRIAAFVGAPEPRSPPRGYELVPGLGWYRLHTSPSTWDEARLACEAEGTHLAVLSSPQEAEALKGIFARAPATIPNASFSHVAHIGFTDLVEGRYFTIFGETLEQAGFAEWGQNQPNNDGHSTDADADCGGIERSGKLNDLPCRSRNAFFCEFHL